MIKNLRDFPYQHVLVLGLAKSGTSAANLLLASGKKVRINDLQAREEDEAVIKFQKLGAEVVLKEHPLSVLDDIEIIVKNPGIPYDIPLIIEAENRGIPIITEIELASKLVEGRLVGITGSNGKTTTTTIATQMLEQSNRPVQMAGNIGVVATEIAKGLKEDETFILELSSFQLLGTLTFKPNIAVLLNVYEAHLDYHKTFENYQESKFNIFSKQAADDYLIYNADDKVVQEAVQRANSTLIPFSTKKKCQDGAWLDRTSIYFKNEKIVDRNDIALVGKHNLENILAAISIAKLSGATNEGIHTVLSTFTGVEHRLQFVSRLNDRLFYNDSKATNLLATQKALAAFEQPTIWLAGGLDRGNDFDDLLPYLKNVKAIVLFGETAFKLKELAEKARIKNVKMAKDMNEAVQIAYSLSAVKDVILLSPACASWDEYRTFEQRGDMFIEAVHTLA